MLKGFRGFLRIFGYLELAVAMGAFCIVIVLVSAQVGTRMVNYSMWWAQEWTEMFIMYAYFLGISHVYKSRHMITMDFVTSRLSRPAQLRFYVFAQVLVIVFCAIAAFEAMRIAPRELDFPSFVVQIPRFYWTLPLIIGCTSMVLTSVYFSIAVVREARLAGPDWQIPDLEASTAIVSVRELEETVDESGMTR